MVSWLRIILVTLAFIAGVAERGVIADDTTAEVTESVVDEAVVETAAPSLPVVATVDPAAVDSRLPHPPPTSSIFRPPRFAS